MVTSTAWRNASTSNCPFPALYFIRFSEARLHAVSSRNMYSLQGLLALIRAVFLHVCQRFTVVSYCIPGSPQCHVESAILHRSSLALYFSFGCPSVTFFVHQSRSSSTARMNSSVTRTEWLAFWKKTELYASPSIALLYPCSISTCAFFSSFTLHSMNSMMSGWSTFRITIFAARRVFPPLLITPAKASNPFMKLTGPDAIPPPDNVSLLPRNAEKFVPVPEPHLNSIPSVRVSPMIDSMLSCTEFMKHAEHCGFACTPTLNHTGELKLIFCSTSRCVSSSRNASRDTVSAKYPPCSPHRTTVFTTRPISCRTELSRSGLPTFPWKYLLATMFVAVCDQPFGTSTSSCLKIVTPFSLPISAVRFSHSTLLNGAVLPSVKYRSNLKPLFVPALAVSTALPFNAGFTVAIQVPPRCRFPCSSGEPLYFTPLLDRAPRATSVVAPISSRFRGRRCRGKSQKSECAARCRLFPHGRTARPAPYRTARSFSSRSLFYGDPGLVAWVKCRTKA